MKSTSPQDDLLDIYNIWIIKPASMSRGRGIDFFNDLASILKYVIGTRVEWIVQKYIERPLIIQNLKFDLRQWILVSDMEPLTVWFFDECYVRFGAEEYDISNLNKKYAHLTNNSIVKHSTDFGKIIPGCMWEEKQLA